MSSNCVEHLRIITARTIPDQWQTQECVLSQNKQQQLVESRRFSLLVLLFHVIALYFTFGYCHFRRIN